jgi:hypothetical protein
MAGCPHPLANGQPSKFQFPLNQDRSTIDAELVVGVESNVISLAIAESDGRI